MLANRTFASDAITQLSTLQADGVIGAAGVTITSANLVNETSTTEGDGSTLTFAFADPIKVLIMGFIGGIPQLAEDCSVDVAGQLVFSENVDAPTADLPVTALFIK